ncbi:MAG: HAMP domain-containing sensor histidine kinase [Chloroflexota bacterium]
MTGRSARSRTPEELVLHRTRTRLAMVTLALVAGLLAAVGVVTQLAATRLMDENVRRAMDGAMRSALGTDETHEDDGSSRTPAGSETFVLYLDEEGAVLGNPSRVALAGLPDGEAMAAAATSADDQRDGIYGGIPVRLLTRQVDGSDAAPSEREDGEDDAEDAGSRVRYVQVGFVLSLHQEQQRELSVAITAAVLLGVAGAGLVTLLVTQRALSPIREAFAAERRFVAAASHELRTPVAIIRASAEVMQREGTTTPAGETLVADIVAETDRLGRLVGDLLALASAEAGAVTVDPRPTDLGAWLDETVRRVEPMVRGRGLRLSTDVDAVRGSVVVADPDRLTQLLLVLVDNAVAHSPGGGTIHVAALREGSRGVVSVTDDGPGIPENLRETIFEPFMRTPGARRSEGSGLGLAIARQLATRQGATLEVANPAQRPTSWGSGACFVLRLPIVTATTTATRRHAPGSASPG